MKLIIGVESKEDRRRVVYHLADDVLASIVPANTLEEFPDVMTGT
jgi:hypothetical protein